MQAHVIPTYIEIKLKCSYTTVVLIVSVSGALGLLILM